MSLALSLRETVLTRPLPKAKRYSVEVLTQLVDSHEEMISQLCVERAEAVSNAHFLSSMIDQHETAAAMLRAHLKFLAGRQNPVAQVSRPVIH